MLDILAQAFSSFRQASDRAKLCHSNRTLAPVPGAFSARLEWHRDLFDLETKAAQA
ncbi:MAG: hypothetical protein LT082_05425 [Comamonas sp.]|nr:hypothetical protein [Comamonas sp.]